MVIIFFDGCFISIFLPTGVDPSDIVYDEVRVRLDDWNVVLDESGCFKTITYVFQQCDLWNGKSSVVTFHPKYKGLDGEPCTQRILVRSHVGNRPMD